MQKTSCESESEPAMSSEAKATEGDRVGVSEALFFRPPGIGVALARDVGVPGSGVPPGLLEWSSLRFLFAGPFTAAAVPFLVGARFFGRAFGFGDEVEGIESFSSGPSAPFDFGWATSIETFAPVSTRQSQSMIR